MTRHSRLIAGASAAAIAIGVLGAGATNAMARNTNTLLGGKVISSTVTAAAPTTQIKLTPAAQAQVKKDMVSYATSGGGQKGLGPLLTELSQVQGIQGTQFGDDLSTLASEMSNESGTSWQNFIDGANKLQAESGEFGPLSTLFYNLGSGLLELYNN